MKHHILTTGISVITNFIKNQEPPPSREEALRFHKKIYHYISINPTEASAEINSLNKRTHFLTADKSDLGLTLIFTQSPEGKLTMSLLEKFLKKRGVALIHKIPVRGFDKPSGDATPEWAQQNVTEALTQLRESVITHITRLRKQSPDLEIELNCTGGFKAEVAVLYEAGRTMRVPVYYLHETFKNCVTLP